MHSARAKDPQTRDAPKNTPKAVVAPPNRTGLLPRLR
jgi:hypothetical protein